VIDKLTAVQEAHDYNDSEMGSRLGISRVHWNNAKHRKVNLSTDVILRAKHQFPEIARDVDIFLSRGMSDIIKPPSCLSRIASHFRIGRR